MPPQLSSVRLFFQGTGGNRNGAGFATNNDPGSVSLHIDTLLEYHPTTCHSSLISVRIVSTILITEASFGNTPTIIVHLLLHLVVESKDFNRHLISSYYRNSFSAVIIMRVCGPRNIMSRMKASHAISLSMLLKDIYIRFFPLSGHMARRQVCPH